MPSDDNPYAPPQSDLRSFPSGPWPADPRGRGTAWRDGDHLLLGGAADLSSRCACCGQQAEARSRQHLVLDGDRTLRVGLCNRHRREAAMLRWMIAAVFLATILGALVCFVFLARIMPFPLPVGIGLLAVVMAVLMLELGEKPLVTIIRRERVGAGRTLIRLGGLHPDVLEGLADWPGRAPSPSDRPPTPTAP